MLSPSNPTRLTPAALMRQQIVEYAYQALESEYGVILHTNKPKYLVEQFFITRAKLREEEGSPHPLDEVSARVPESEPSTIWLYRRDTTEVTSNE